MSILHLLIKASRRSMPRVSRGVHQVDPLMRKDAQFKLHALPLLLTTLTGAVRSFGAPIFSSARCTVVAALCPSLTAGELFMQRFQDACHIEEFRTYTRIY